MSANETRAPKAATASPAKRQVPKSTEEILSARDIDFLLYDWLDVESLTERERYQEHSRETFDAVLDVSEQIAKEYFYPHARKADQNEPTFDGERVHMIPEVGEALEQFAQAGLLTGPLDEDLGGIQLPNTVARASFAWFQAANIGTSAYPMLTLGNANLLLAHGSAEQIDTYVRPELEGRFFGTMCLSEPEVGSSLGDVTTTATEQADGSYRVHGQKMWISGGEHELTENIVHLVLARAAGDPVGSKGLSLFIVPKFLVNADGSLGQRNDVALSGLNHKMGFRGTTNTLLNFGDGQYTPDGRAGAVGYLVGERTKGLAYMFHMMNEARIGVGAGAAALGYNGYLYALDYARGRLQGRLVESKDPNAAQVPIVKHSDVRRMLLASKSYVEGSLGLIFYAARLLDDSQTAPTAEERDRAALLLDVLTPIIKTWPSQWGLEANFQAIQVLGGAGYTRDHDVEQLYRDNRLNPIHEGTHGIQANDLLGRKVIMKGGAGLRLLAETIRATIAKATEVGEPAASGGTGQAAPDAASPAASPSAWVPQARALDSALTRLESVTASLWAGGDPRAALANAWVYLEAAGHTVLAWLWLEQALAAQAKLDALGSGDGADANGEAVAGSRANGTAVGGEVDFLRGKLAAARYFFSHELPRTGPQFDLLESGDTSLPDLDDDWL